MVVVVIMGEEAINMEVGIMEVMATVMEMEEVVVKVVHQEQTYQAPEPSVTNSTQAMMFLTPKSPIWLPNGVNFWTMTSH